MTVIEKLENNIAEVNSAFQNIKSKIVSHGVDVADELRPSEYASKVDAVYDAGKKAQEDTFLEQYQQSGNRRQYLYAFAYPHWTDELYKPKYSIKAQNESSLANLYYYSAITDTIVEIDATPAYTSNSLFNNATALKTIRKIIVTERNQFNSWFNNCGELENINIEGVIGKSIDFTPCTKLSKASITNIVECLSTTASGQTVTFSETAVETAFGSADSAEWQSLISTKSNWTISLV